MLLPSRHTALRARIDGWLQTESIKPKILGEFEDSALLATFAGTGLGLFPAVLVSKEDLKAQYDSQLLAEIPGIREQVFAITNEQRIQQPLVDAMLSNGRRLWGHDLTPELIQNPSDD